MRLHKTGGPEVLDWEDVQVCTPAEGQARIRDTAVGVNFLDAYYRSGHYPISLPTGLGSEGAGVVKAVGRGVKHVQIGDRVAYADGPWLLVTRPMLATYTATRADLEAAAKDLFDVVLSGKVKIEINLTCALRDAQQVHRDLESRKTTGSIVMVP
jgi:NADPH:quinone reductase-like Zn-dependent oxidoreductase